MAATRRVVEPRTMLPELSLATAMVVLTVLMHGVGLVVLARLLELEILQERAEHIPPVSLRALVATLLIVLGLFALHGLEIWSYAFLYEAIGAIHGLRESVYFSTITYGTIGYDDHAMAERWHLLAGIEGINGILLLGWSTAFFVTRISRVSRF